MLRLGLMALLCAGMTYSQTSSLEFSGYAMTLPAMQEGTLEFTGKRSDRFTVNLTRIRLRPVWFVSERLRLVWEHEVDALFSTRPLENGIHASKNRQIADLRWQTSATNHTRVGHTVDRLYLRADTDRATMIAGRQRIAWGTGRVWNPTDLFNPINPADYGKIEKDGADAVSIKWTMGSFTDLQTVILPQETFRGSHAGARFRTNAAETDVSAMMGFFDRRTVLGGDVAGNLGGAGFRGELALFSERDSKRPDHMLASAGLDVQLTPRLYGLTEYFYNGRGEAKKSNYKPAEVLEEGGFQLGRHYVFLQALYQMHALVSVSISTNRNIRDDSGFLQSAADYSAASWLQAGVGWIWFYGEKTSEYDFYSDALFLRLTAYF